MYGDKRTTIVLYGEVITTGWWDWYIETSQFLGHYGMALNHFEAKIESLRLRLYKLSKSESKLKKALSDYDHSKDYLTLYALPDGFTSFVEYIAYATLENSSKPYHISLSVPTEIYDTWNQVIIEQLIEYNKKYIEYTHGEIFECLYNENPFMYTSKIKSATDIPNFKLIRKLGDENKVKLISELKEDDDDAQENMNHTINSSEINHKKRDNLFIKAKQIEEKFPNSQFGPLVSINDFFDGNGDPDSIAVHVHPHPSLASFRKILEDLEQHEQVQRVLVEIIDYTTDWPYSERVVVVTTLDSETLDDMLEEIQPSEVADLELEEDPQLPHYSDGSGYRIYGVWWD